MYLGLNYAANEENFFAFSLPKEFPGQNCWNPYFRKEISLKILIGSISNIEYFYISYY